MQIRFPQLFAKKPAFLCINRQKNLSILHGVMVENVIDITHIC